MSVYGSRIVFCNPTLAMREVFKDKVDFTGWLVVQRWRWGSFRPCDHDATATALPWLITSKHWFFAALIARWDGCGGTRPSAPDDEQSPGPRLLQMNVHIVCDDAKQDAFHLQSALEAQYKKVKQMFPWITEACCTRTALPSYDDRETLCPQTLRMRFCCWYTRAPSARPSDSIDHRARPPRTGHRPIRSGGELPRHRSGDRQPRHWRSHGHQGEEDHLHGGG